MTQKIKNKYKDISVGDIIGRWEVLGLSDKIRVGKTNGQIYKYFDCKCLCGNSEIRAVEEKSLKYGVSKSCGCLQKEAAAEIGRKRLDDLTGRYFNDLYVVKRVENVISPNGTIDTRYLVRCICGNEFIVRRSNLISGDTRSCGCLYSTAESTIFSILQSNNYNFKSQYIFRDLLGPKGGYLRYDFGVLNPDETLHYLIEYDGLQHYQKEKGSWERLEDIQYRDRLKNEYCIQHNIPLIRLPAIDVDLITIDDLSIDTTMYLVTSIGQYQD